MTLEESRKTLFQKKLWNLEHSEKEWKKLIMESVGLSKYRNLLLSNGLSDPLWNIIMDYVQISPPKINRIEKTDYCSLRYDNIVKICDLCDIKYDDLLFIAYSYIRDKYRDKYICYSSICKTCFYKNIPRNNKINDMLDYSHKYIKFSYKTSATWHNMLVWLGFVDFDHIE